MAKSLDFWRGYFSGGNSDICDIIENAVIVAALDHPESLKLKRDRIAELLFTCQLTKCFGCERGELSEPKNSSDGETLLEGEKLKSDSEFEEEGKTKGKESKVDCCDDGNDGHAMIVSYEQAEEFNDELEKESQLIEEVLRIKQILDSQEESESMLLDLLRRLQLMDLSVEILKVTGVGKSVNGLRKHGSKKIKDFVKTLIKGWVDMLDSYYLNATTAINEDTPDSKKTSLDSGHGLPSPPLEEGAFVTHSIELSEFFADMDDDGNPINKPGINNNRGSGRKPPLKDGNVPKHKQQQPPNAFYAPPQENKVQQTMKGETIGKKKDAAVNPNKPSSNNTALTKARAEQKVIKKSQAEGDERALSKKPFAHQDDVSPKNRDQQSANGAKRNKLLPPQKEKLTSSDEATMHVKIEAAKRKLQERYQEQETAKKQRTNQITPLHDITKQGAGWNHIMKPGHSNHNRH